jgi:hypothetical protein
VLVARREVARSLDVLRDAVDVVRDARKRVLEAPLDQCNGKMRDVDADPLPAEFFRGMNGGAAAAKGIEDDVAGVGGGGDDAFEQRDGLLRGVAEAFLSHGVHCRNIRPNR